MKSFLINDQFVYLFITVVGTLPMSEFLKIPAKDKGVSFGFNCPEPQSQFI